jgi:heptosyltransferase-1/heptosyltransferase-2
MMFFKLSKNSSVKKILVVSLTNIGDILAICPAMDILLNDFPGVKLSIVVGPKGRSLFEENPNIDRVYIYDKHAGIKEKLDWFSILRKERFDVVVDFRNSFLPFLLDTATRTPPELFMPKGIHLIDKHLLRLKSIYNFLNRAESRKAIVILPKDRLHVDALVGGHLTRGEKFVLVAPVAADSAKTWHPQGFAKICDGLIAKYGIKVIMVGGREDETVMNDIQSQMKYPILTLAGRTNLVQVAELVNRSLFSVVHDSGIMHLASYFDRQVLALFGPTDPRLSGPWSANSGYIWKNQRCQRCADSKNAERHTCMNNINPEDVLDCIKISGNNIPELFTIS